MCLRPAVRTVLLLAALLSLAGCGAGLITGIASSKGGNGAGEVRPPALTITPLLPLVPEANATRTAVVANAQIAASAQLRVLLKARGIEIDQVDPTVTGQGGSTLVTFSLSTAAIVATVADPTAADVPGTLEVMVDDRAIADAVPILLVRQPRAELDLGPAQTERFLSPFGERTRVRVDGLHSTELAGLQMLVQTADPSAAPPAAGEAWPTVTRVCTDLQFESTGPTTVLSAVVPGSTFPTVARLFVRDAIAGESTVIDNAYYQPDIALALPSQGPTTGGNLVTLIGTALAPLDLSGTSLPEPDFSHVEIAFAKGGRVVQLRAEDFRTAESGTDRLVFTMPASPDGRPGPVDIVLRVPIGTVTATVTASQVFLFANPKPFFGPRGAVLDRVPVAVTPIFLDAEPGSDAAPDFAVLTEQGGFGFLQLLLAQQNGMFQPFAAPRQIGDNEVAAESGPADICTGDFNDDGVPDMFLANVGASVAMHHVVLGRARPATPLGDTFTIAADPGTRFCRAADFDQDGIDDVLLVPGPAAPAGLLPQVLLARPAADGSPVFAPPVYLPVRTVRHDAVDVADLDGDGHLDVVLFRGGSLQVDFAYGNGDGTFVAGQQLDVTLPNYLPDEGSPGVGVHACLNGPLQSIVLVWAGLRDVLQTAPGYVILPQTSARHFAPPGPASLPPAEPFGCSLVADLDGQPPAEMVVSIAGDPSLISLGLLRFFPTGFLPIAGGVETGAELPRQIRELHFGRAYPPTSTVPEARAVFVVHQSDIDGIAERRLSTRLIYTGDAPGYLPLLPPDAGARFPAAVDGLVGGNFQPGSAAAEGLQRDLALARPDFVKLIENDGYGGFPLPTDELQWPGLLPHSMTLLPSPAGQIDRLVFAGSDSRIAVWRHVPGTQPALGPGDISGELRLVGAPPLHDRVLADASRVVIGDVDGDGVDDAVVLLSFDVATPGEGDAAIALLRGKAAPAVGEFPFHEPVALTPVHGNTTAIALGDFAASSDGARQLEMAVAIPRGTSINALDGDQVRFYRYAAGATPEEDRFVPSWSNADPDASHVLFSGNGPTQVAAADFDRDGLVDLLVAGAADSQLRLFRNVASPAPGQPEVDIDAFLESLASPQPMAAGTPTSLKLSDLNGDGRLDAVAVTEFTTIGNTLTTAVAFYLSSAVGEFTGPQFVSPDRVGNRDGHLALDIGDWNRDGLPDLLLGWNTFADGDRNVRVLFGGTR